MVLTTSSWCSGPVNHRGAHLAAAPLDVQAVRARRLAKVRATLDWIENAVDTGKVDMDDELAALLRGQ